MFFGYHPQVDFKGNPWPDDSREAQLAGTPLCDGEIHIIIFCITGDLEFTSKELKFPHFNADVFCWQCPCNRQADAGPLSMSNLAEDAQWKAQIYTPAYDFFNPVTTHPIRKLVNFARCLLENHEKY